MSLGRRINITLLLLVCGSLRAVDAAPAARFSIAVLPDTQHYSRAYPAIFHDQTRWIVDHTRSDAIAFTVHLGDVVDRAQEAYEWQNADGALKRLEAAAVPYSVIAGNHDLLNSRLPDVERAATEEPFLRYFPPERFQNKPLYGGHSPSGFSAYFVFEAAGQQFLVLALDYALAETSFQWVQTVLDAHPTLPTILTTHRLLHIVDQTPELDRYGKIVWERLIAPNNQIFLTINGHYPGVTHTVMQNNAGNDVLLVLVDYQNDCRGGNGMMRLLTFDLREQVIQVESFSPYVIAKPPDQRTPCDIERKTDAANQFMVELDILRR